MGVVYMGAFPPEYGGVTMKNQNLYIALEKEMPIKRVDFNKVKGRNIKEAVRLVFHLLNPADRFVVGVSGKQTRKRFTQALYYFNRRAMKRSIIMVMGGSASYDMSVDPEYGKCAKSYRKIYVETRGMKAEMDAAGFDNVELYPNGRFRPLHSVAERNEGGKLNCVFFSKIQPEKGADLVLRAAKELPDVHFAFYGSIADDYQDSFMADVKRLDNVAYHGIFTGSSEKVYAELAKYDILLFPTKWDKEGAPGILVEGKISGIAEIVSNKSYNSELVRNGMEGIVLKENTSAELCVSIQKLERDRELLSLLKTGSRRSAEQYYIENYIDAIRKELEG